MFDQKKKLSFLTLKVRWIITNKLIYYKLRQLSLLQSATRFITNYDRYYKVRWLLQIATGALRGLSIDNQFDEQYPKAMIVNLICHPWWQLLMKWYTLKIRDRIISLRLGILLGFGQNAREIIPWFHSLQIWLHILIDLFRSVITGKSQTRALMYTSPSREIKKRSSYREFELSKVKLYRKRFEGKWKLLRVSGRLELP